MCPTTPILWHHTLLFRHSIYASIRNQNISRVNFRAMPPSLPGQEALRGQVVWGFLTFITPVLSSGWYFAGVPVFVGCWMPSCVSDWVPRFDGEPPGHTQRPSSWFSNCPCKMKEGFSPNWGWHRRSRCQNTCANPCVCIQWTAGLSCSNPTYSGTSEEETGWFPVPWGCMLLGEKSIDLVSWKSKVWCRLSPSRWPGWLWAHHFFLCRTVAPVGIFLALQSEGSPCGECGLTDLEPGYWQAAFSAHKWHK